MNKDNRSIAVVTTFDQKSYYKYGRNMISSFNKRWPRGVDLYVYYEKEKPNIKSNRIHFIDINKACPGLNKFKKKWKNDPRANGWKSSTRFGYKWMAIKFSHKVYCISHAARTLPHDILVWLDADTVSTKWVSNKFIYGLIPKKFYCSYLGRGKRHSECGFMAFSIKHRNNIKFMDKYQWYYDSGDIFNLEQWNDCYVFDHVRKRMHKKNEIRALDLTPNINYENFNVIMEGRMVHFKGSTKKDSSKNSAMNMAKSAKQYAKKNNLLKK